MYTPTNIADWFLANLDTEAGDTMSPLKLQKLLYYAQAWHLTLFKRPLFQEDMQAWRHGPAVPSQYERFASLTKHAPISVENADVLSVPIADEVEDLLIDIATIYGEHQASYLEQLTHSEVPWIKARAGVEPYERSTKVISHQTMIDFYSKMLPNDQQQKSAA